MSEWLEFGALAFLLLLASGSVLIPRLLGYRIHWFDALMLFGATTFVRSFLKILYIRARDDGVPLWSINADYANGAVAILLFALLAAAGYVTARMLTPGTGARHRSGVLVDIPLLGLVCVFLTAVCALAFAWVLLFSSIDLSPDNLSA